MAADKVIKIGTLYPLTGAVATAGQRCKAAVETAVEVINNAHPELNVPLAKKAGLLDGYKIELVHADHQGKPNVGKNEAERLYNQENVYSIVGCYNSAVTKPASFVAERKKKIFMCGASSSAALTKRNFNYFFRIAPTDEIESKEFVELLHFLEKDQGAEIETVACIAENTEFGVHAMQEGEKAAKEGGYDVVETIPFSPGSTNLNSEIQTLKAADPDAVFAGCLGGDYTLWVQTMKQMNWLPKVALNYCSGYQDPVIAEQLGQDGWYFMGGTGYSPEFADLMPEVAGVENIYKQKTDPSVPFDSDSIRVAVAMFTLAQAIDQAGTLDTEKVAEVLRNSEFQSPLSMSGKVAFAPGGQNMKAQSMITQLVDGKYRRVFPPNLAEAGIVYPMPAWNNR
jgi:branched-chain amino acid transport system substrate-binding protein